MMKILRKIIMTGILVILAAGCAGYYPDITGTVVDDDTGQPIEGAIVLVEWTKRVGVGDYHTESVKVVEVVTDREGRFKVIGITDPSVDQPDLTIYKKEYVAWNNNAIFPQYEKRTDFKWQSGLLFRLEKFKKEYTHDKHEDFIRTSMTSSLNLEMKRKLYDAFEWEREIAFQERQKRNYIENKRLR